MIVSMASVKKRNLLMWCLGHIRYYTLQIFKIRLDNLIKQDHDNLKLHYQVHYPNLLKEDNENIKCIGCELCVAICPTNSIGLKFPNLVDFPPSLEFGEAPSSFMLKVSSCIQCGHCAVICPVQALDLKGKFNQSEVDLLKDLDD